MTLPAITLPKIELPFDIPVLLHPPIDHFMIALPVVVLFLELINLGMKKKAIGGISFFLLFLTVIIAAGAYLTGLTDGKEAFPALGEAAKTALSEHKLLGTYLLLTSVVVFFFKFLSVLTRNGLLKSLYLLVLIVFVAGIFEQGEEGGKLVYTHGLNVERVIDLDDELSDLKEELEELTPQEKTRETVATPAVTESVKKSMTPEPVKSAVVESEPAPDESAKTEIKKEVVPAAKESVPEVSTAVEPKAAESVKTEIKEEVAPAVKEAVPAVSTVIDPKPVESVKTEVKEEVEPTVKDTIRSIE